MARLDEIEEAAVRGTGRGGVSSTPAVVGVAFVRPVWTVEQYLPSLRRRAERHRPHPCWFRCCTRCASCVGDDELALPYPCPDFRDLCAEIGIEP